jgi:simple sugar transport system ATP-binding protein
MVHQHFMLVDRLTAMQNVVLGAETGFWLKGGVGGGRDRIQALQARYGLDFPLDHIPHNLSVGTQQRIEILKALYRDASVLILDEPTSVLTPQEVDVLFTVFKDLKAEGKTVVLITHKLREILAVTDNVTILRQGRCVDTVPTATVTRSSLAEAMVGRKINPVALPATTPSPRPKLSIRDLVVKGQGSVGVRGLSFDLHGSEILGIAGVAGNGQSELLMALSGLAPVIEGEIRTEHLTIDNKSTISPGGLRQGGLGNIPEDRHRNGVIGEWTGLENSILGLQRRNDVPGVGLSLNWRRIEAWCRDLLRDNDVRPPDPHRPIGVLSGGNQQKLVIGRELALEPDILLIGQPTRGVDIGAIEAIHGKLVEQRNRGRALLLVSVELDEIFALSDRVIVMFEGRSMGELSRSELSETLVGMMMAGMSKAEALGYLNRRESA